MIRGVPGDERRVGEHAAARRDDGVEVGRRGRAKVPVHLIVDGAPERSVEPLLRAFAQRIKAFARALHALGVAARSEELGQEQVRDRLARGRGIRRAIADGIERIDRGRRGADAGAEGEGGRAEGEEASGGAKKAGTHRRAL